MKFIERNSEVGFGQPVIIGRRLTVFNVITTANYRDSIAEYLDEFEVSMEELRSAVSYCMNRDCQAIEGPTDQYCDGCILRSISEGWSSIKDDYTEFDGISYSNDGNTIFLGSISELEDEEFGIMGWIHAEEVERKITQLL